MAASKKSDLMGKGVYSMNTPYADARWTNALLYVICFASGAAVLAIEILGTRVLGPFYGVTLFLWSALITVTLISLSVGYVIGGRFADRKASLSSLGTIIGAAGAWMVGVAWIKRPVIELLEGFGLKTAVLGAAMLLFGLPLTLLGMVSPIAIRVKARELAVVGRSAGDLYAVSTMGGVLAALLTGFVLIPRMGIQRLSMIIGVVLLLVAASVRLLERKTRANGIVGVLAIAAFGAGGVAAVANPAAGAPLLLAVEQSPYGEIRVLDDGEGSRHLLIDGGAHSSVVIGSWQSLQGYIWVTDISKRLFARPGKLLLLGLGAGSTAMSFAKDGWQVKAVEIDPVVTRLAREHFGLELAHDAVVDDDARRFVRTATESYDVIVLDAFSSNSIPLHLFTTEAFELMARRLTARGVLVLNIESIGRRGEVVQSVAATLREHLPNVLALPIVEDPDALSNIIVMASKRPLEPSRPDGVESFGLEFQRVAWNQRFVPDRSAGVVLTDDDSPVDLWSEEINSISRGDLRRGFADLGLDDLSW
jgi:spermidine synthase